MPKRQKQSRELPGEGRPAALNLGDFLSSQTENKQQSFPPLLTVSPSPSSWGGPAPTAEPPLPPPASSSWVRPSPSPGDHPLPPPASSSQPGNETKSGLAYSITWTKKGGIPIRVESRNKGKKVTVVFNVSGDSRELLKELKHSAGCGGVVREDTIELQGEKVAVVEKVIKSKMGWR